MAATVSFPLPVLGNGDDVSGELPRMMLTPEVSGTVVGARLSPSPLTTGNPSIDSLVQKGAAKWFLRVHCARTYFRSESVLEPSNPRIELSTERVEGEVQAELFVIAATTIASYRPEGIHPDYADASFDVSPGEILVLGPVFTFIVEPRFDPMRADVRSLIQFVKAEETTGPIRIDLGGELINVYIPQREWELVHELNNDVPELLHACLALPALMEAIQNRQEGDTRKWASRLTSLLQTRNIPATDAVEAAQRLLENPVLRGLAKTELAIRRD